MVDPLRIDPSKTWEMQNQVLSTTRRKVLCTSNSRQEQASQKKFQSIIGGLLFIAQMTRPEISIHVNLLGRRAQDPSIHNLEGAHRVLSYLKSTPQEGVVLRKPSNLDLKIFVDTSYGDKGETSRSQTGVLTTLGEQLIG